MAWGYHYGSRKRSCRSSAQKFENSELKAFYDLYFEKFNNKTNGITFCRWLMHASKLVSLLGREILGREWHHKLLSGRPSSYENKAAVKKKKLESIKAHNKRRVGSSLERAPRCEMCKLHAGISQKRLTGLHQWALVSLLDPNHSILWW